MMTHVIRSVYDTTLHLHQHINPTLTASPNQDRLLRLTCYSLDGFFNSIYDYEQSFINFKEL
jgi:hypothetical protein